MTGRSVPDPGNKAPPENVFRELEVTNETLLDVYLSADQSISAGSWAIVAFDTENKDERNEFDTSTHKFTPDEDGWYLVVTGVEFSVGADQDDLIVTFRDDTAGSDLANTRIGASGTSYHDLKVLDIIELTEGHDYVVRAQNASSSDTLTGTENVTFLAIRRVYR